MNLMIRLKYLLFVFPVLGFAQSNYFQQEVNYEINVKLNDVEHSLTGIAEVEYINNAPETLTEIYFHLWGNAYLNKKTAFAKQQLRNGSERFYFAPQKQLGGYTAIDFSAKGQNLTWQLDEENPDIALIKLSEALQPGSSVTFTIPFTLKIPTSFSRLGHVGTSYQMTQWYPKPAVYDHKGWHPMPYLDQGEFYSEFGSFDVSITLPENYVVGATGVLQTESEKEFLTKRQTATSAYLSEGDTTIYKFNNRFPASASQFKTIRYKAENVHDFGWFADKRFRVIKDEVTLKSGKKVDTWVMFTKTEEDLWEKAIQYVNNSVLFYSEKVGAYPYPHATAVQSALSAGAGMEYPMITVIGESGTSKSLDRVITHEVGHNWFYGILASNERDHPWMDEGMNSFYETLYMKEYYENNSGLFTLPKFIRGESKTEIDELAYLYLARSNKDQAPNTSSNSMTSVNYGIQAYLKPILIFRHLAAYLGKETFDASLQSYYDEWKFKHPYPEDLKKQLETQSGKDLTWLFDGYLYSNQKLDYAIQNVKESAEALNITIKNKGEIVAPFPIAAVKEGEVVATKWYDGSTGTKILQFPKGDYDDLVIDVDRVTLDVDRSDNRYRLNKAFKKARPYSLDFLAQLEDESKNQEFFLPVISFNNYDKIMLGLAFHNLSVPSKNLEVGLQPMYAFGSNRLTGLGTIRYNFYPSSNWFERISLQFNGKSFSYAIRNDDNYDTFVKIAPELSFKFAKSEAISPVQQTLSLRWVYVDRDLGIVNVENNSFDYGVGQLTYDFDNDKPLNPFNTRGTFEFGSAYAKVFANHNHYFSYSKPNKGLSLTAFAGAFLNYNSSKINELLFIPQFRLGGNTGSTFQNDYLFDEILFGRSDASGIWSRQIYAQDAGFKTTTPIGRTDEWMLGLGLETTIPGPLPIKFYVDAALTPSIESNSLPNRDNDDGFYYSAGLNVTIVDDLLEFYFPLFESDAIVTTHNTNGREGFFERMTFRLNLKSLNPFDIVNDRLPR